MEKKINYTALVLVFCLLFASGFVKSQTINDAIIFKLDRQYKSFCSKSNINIEPFNRISQFGKLRQKFPANEARQNTKSSNVELSTIYHLKLKPNQSQNKVLRYLNQLDGIVYAEADYQYQLTYSPNDPRKTEQDYLDALKVYDAWDIEKGDSTVVIAITDTGTDLDHPELVNRLALNHQDSINGIDDDQDGFIDNFYGWNVASNNNNVSFQNSGHGTNVAGIACSQVDNNFGISGIGFNVKFLTVRIDLPSGQLSNAYESIVYAVDHGADIINCSWGGYRASSYGQDVVRYATERGALVIAGAGNNGISNRFYPAAYEEVIAVGQTEGIDTIRPESNYGYWLDIFAPGDRILTTNVIGGFGTNGGTSMSAPMISAGAALIKSQNPNFGPEQIAQRLFITADNIEGLSPTNRPNESGYGRANLFRALTETNSPSIEFIDETIINGNDHQYEVNDTILLSGNFINYLAPSNSIAVKLSSNDGNIQIINPNKTIPPLSTLDTFNIQQSPFQIVIKSNLDYNSEIVFVQEMTFNGIVKRQKFAIELKQDYITVNNNTFRHTITSNGAIGYSGNSSNLGDGVVFDNNNFLLFEGSFILGNSTAYVADRFRNDSNGVDKDFSVLGPIEFITPQKTDVELSAVFNDSEHPNKQELLINQHNYLINSSTYKDAVIYVYNIKNQNTGRINQLKAGIIMDWDIGDYRFNKITYDPIRKLSISYDQDSSIFCGIKLLNTNLDANHYAIANISGGDGTINLSDGFSDDEKHTVLSSPKELQNVPSRGVDVIDALSTLPFNLEVDSSETVSYLIFVDTAISSLKQKADSIQFLFETLSLDLIEINDVNIKNTDRISVYPNPSFQAPVQLEFDLKVSQEISIRVFDTNGTLVLQEDNKRYTKGKHRLRLTTESLKSGVYFLSINGNNLNFDDTFVISGR